MLDNSLQMVSRSHFDSNLPTKVFTMTPEEENCRTKLRRIGSPDISTAEPVLVSSFHKTAPSVFAFTAKKNEPSHADHVARNRKITTRGRCRVCNRPNVTKASSTASRMWPDMDVGTTSSFNFKQSEPSMLLVRSCVNGKFVDGFQTQFVPVAAEPYAMVCPATPDNQIQPVKTLEDTDQIVKKASEMVKLLESHIAALQLSSHARKTLNDRMIPVQASPKNSNFKIEEPVNPYKQPKHKLDGTLHQASLPANSFVHPPILQNFSTAFTVPIQTPILTQSLSHIPYQTPSPAIPCPCQTPSPTSSLSYSPYQPQIPAVTCPCQTPSYTPNQLQSPVPSQTLEQIPMHTLSSIPTQKPSSTPTSRNVKNIVQRLESLNISPSHYDRAPNPNPTINNAFTFPPLRSPTKAGLVLPSSSPGINRHSSETHTPSLNRKVKHQTSKLIKSHKPSPRHHYSSVSSSSCSVSSSSWTTTQQSGSEQSEECSYSSPAESSRISESEYSTEATTTSSASSPIARTFTRRRSKKKKQSASNEKPISRLRRIKNKLGLIFHHHHHHHHHHHDEEKAKPSSKKKASDAVLKPKDQQGQFRALIGGLMRHARVRKKKKSKPLKEIGRFKKKVQFGRVGKRRRGLKLPRGVGRK